MPKKISRGNPRDLAQTSLENAVEELLQDPEWKDVNWLPDDFAERITEIAWKHRGGSLTGPFKKDMKAYIVNEIAPNTEEKNED